ncbi:MAG: tetratricopeptide repeat protein [Chloroflexota bacterium]
MPLHLHNQIVDEEEAIAALAAEIDSNTGFQPVTGRDAHVTERTGRDAHATILRLAIGLTLICAVVIAAVFYWPRPSPPANPCQPQHTAQPCILVAKLGGMDNATTQAIVDQLIHDLSSPDDVQVVPISTKITSRDQARQQLRQTDAWLMLWGNILIADSDANSAAHPVSSQLNIVVTLTDQLDIGGATTIRPERVQPLTYNHFTIDITCAADMLCNLPIQVEPYLAVIASIAQGLIQYAGDNPAGAYREFTTAMNRLIEQGATEELDAAIPAWQSLAQLPCDVFAPDVPLQETATQATHFDTSLLHYYMGKALLLQGSYAHALRHLAHAVEQHPCDPATWFAIAELYHRWIRTPETVMTGEVAVALDKAEQAVRSLRGSGYHKAIEHRLALAYQEGMIDEFRGDINPDHTAASDDYQAAAAHYRTALGQIENPTRDPRTYVTYVSLGRVLRHAGDTHASKRELNRAIVLDRQAAWAHLELARTHAQAGRSVQAERALDEAANDATNVMAVALTRADLCAYVWRDIACAMTAYAEAEQARPLSRWLHSKIGDFYRTAFAQPVWATASKHYTEAVNQRSEDAWAYARLGQALYHQQRFGEAAEAYMTAIELSYPDAAPTRWVRNAGTAYVMAEDVSTEQMDELALMCGSVQ